MSRSDHHFKMGSDPQYAQDYAKLEAYSDWVDKGDRNPYDGNSADPKERARESAYYGYVSNMTDGMKVGEVDENHIRDMSDDPNADLVHGGAMGHVDSEWKNYLND